MMTRPLVLWSVAALSACAGADAAPVTATTADATLAADASIDAGTDAGPTGSAWVAGSLTDPLSRVAGSVALVDTIAGPGALAASSDRLAVCDGKSVRILDGTTLAPVTDAKNTVAARCVSLAFGQDGFGYASLNDGTWVSITAKGAQKPRIAKGPKAAALRVAGDRVWGAAYASGLASLGAQGDAVVHGVGTDARGLAVLPGGDLLLADGRMGTHRVQVSGDQPKVLASLDPGDIDWAPVALSAERAAVATAGAGLRLLDISGGGLTDLGLVPTDGIATALAVGPNGTLIVADWTDVRVLDVSNPKKPAILARERFLPSETSLGRALGLATAAGGLVVLGLDAVTRLHLNLDVMVPEVTLGRTSVRAGVAAGDTVAEYALLVSNTGRAPLELTGITLGSARLAIGELDPKGKDGTSVAVPVGEPGYMSFKVTGAEPLETSIAFQSNDPDFPTVTIPFAVNPPLVQVGKPPPDFLLPDLDGGFLRLSNVAKVEHRVVYLKVFNAL